MQTIKQPKEVAEKSLHNILKLENFLHQDELDREFIAKAFFLPKEVLQSGMWKIENIRVCSGEEWQRSLEFVKAQGANICYDPNSEEIIKAARHVGVSIRRHAVTNETFIVVKLWYGDGDSHKVFSPRKPINISRQRGSFAAYDKPSAHKE